MITVPLPPSANHAYLTRKGSHQRVRTQEYKDYEALVMVILKGMKPLDYISRVDYYFYWPDRRRRDVENYLKVLKDCLKGRLFTDDCWAVLPKETQTSTLDRKEPRVEIEITR